MAIYFLFFLTMPNVSAYADADITEGYDENTEISVKGTVTEIMSEIRGPVILKLRTDKKVYNVVTAPRWFLSRQDLTFQTGAELEVTGSKYLGRDGILYLIAMQIKSPATGKTLQLRELRDKMCRPLWKKQGMGEKGRH